MIADGSAYICASDTGQVLRHIEGRWESDFEGNPNHSAILSPDSKYLLIGKQVWEVATGKYMNQITQVPGLIMKMSFTPERKYLCGLFKDGLVRVWETAKVIPPLTAVNHFEQYE